MRSCKYETIFIPPGHILKNSGNGSIFSFTNIANGRCHYIRVYRTAKMGIKVINKNSVDCTNFQKVPIETK